MITEADILQCINKSNELATKLLYEKYANLCFMLSMRYLNNKELAEEIVMNSFIKAHNHIHKFENKGEGSLKAWLKKIVVNECLMQLRKKKDFITEELSDYTQLETSYTDLHKLHYNDILKLIFELPEHLKAIFNLYEIEGYSHNEIAQLLAISVGTSKSSLSRAKAALREKCLANGLI